MENKFEIYLHFFFIIPILVFISICILMGRQPKGSAFYFFLILCFFLIILLHINRIVHLVNQIRERKPIEKEYGVIILIFAIFLLILNLRAFFH